MEIRYFIDAETGLPHIYRHDVTEADVDDILRRPIEDRPGELARLSPWCEPKRDGILRIVFVPDPKPDSVFVITA